MQNFKCALLSLVAAASFSSFSLVAQEPIEFAEKVDLTKLSRYDASYLYKSTKDLNKCFAILSTDAFAFPLDARELSKMVAWLTAYYAYLRFVSPVATNSLTESDGLDKTGKFVIGRVIDLLPAKLAWDRFGKDIEALNRFIDAWVGYGVDQAVAAVKKSAEAA
jgi:hypothetical protein